jgi:hypothetical protein
LQRQQSAKTAAKPVDGEAPSAVEFARPFASTDPTKAWLFFTPLQIVMIRNSNDTLTFGITIL